jgi:2-oxoisovalerate dehydrogenase E1 component alpha subunit
MSMRAALHQVRDAGEQLIQLSARPYPLPILGLEAVIAGGFLGVEKKDWVVPGLRERAGAVLRGCPAERLVDGLAGARPYKVAPITESPAARMLHACGLAMAARDQDQAVLCFIGQGSASYGAFHEALNLAALHHLRVIFLAHSFNLDAEDSPLSRQIAGALSGHAMAYGVQARTVDGGLITEVLSAVTDARAAGGPRLIDARLLRGEDPLARAYDELTETEPHEANLIS